MIETVVALILGLRKGNQLLIVALVSVVTHPILHCIILITVTFGILQSPLSLWLILFLEACVVIAEAVILWNALKIPLWRAALTSFAMNLASWSIGYMMTRSG